MDKENFILASIASAIGGAVIGLLFAPDKGSKTRRIISERSNELLQGLNQDIKILRNDMDKRVSSTKKEINDLGKDAKRRGDDILKKAKKITSYDEWTKEELYNRAKELEIENYSTMNKPELIEALQNN